MKNKKFWGHMLALFTCFVWGTSFVSSKVLLAHMTALELLVIRFILAYVLLWLLYPHKLKLKEKRSEFYLFLAGFSGVTLYFLGENLALTYTYASNVSLIVATAPLFTGIFVHWAGMEKLSRNFVIGFVVSIVGVALISFNSGSVLELNPKGDLLALVAAICWGVYSVFATKVMNRNYNILAVTRRIFFYGLITMIPFIYFMGFDIELKLFTNPTILVNLLLLGVLSSAVCFVTWGHAMNILGAVTSSTYIYLLPVITVIFAVFILDEKITFYMACGVVLIITGLFLSQSGSKRKTRKRK